MMLRILLPSSDRPAADAAWSWSLSDGRGGRLREGAAPLADVPRADRVEAVLPASRVLFARLRLPKVNAATIRELLPYAVEDRLLADPAQIHAVPGATNAAGETLVAVVDRGWLAGAIDVLAGAGLAASRAWCESALLPPEKDAWHAVIGGSRSFLVEGDGYAVAFDRPPGDEPPLAVRIAIEEALANGTRPARLTIHVEPGLAAPSAAAWRERLGVEVHAQPGRPDLSAAASPQAIDLLAGEFSRRAGRAASLAVPRAAWGIAAAIVAMQFFLTLADAWRMEREWRSLEAEREAIFRAAFPEAKAVVDPALQMRRNLAGLQHARGRPAATDFLVLATAAARNDPAPAKRLGYSAGRLEIDRGGAAR
jgi:general secretion pathway protein L